MTYSILRVGIQSKLEQLAGDADRPAHARRMEQRAAVLVRGGEVAAVLDQKPEQPVESLLGRVAGQLLHRATVARYSRARVEEQIDECAESTPCSEVRRSGSAYRATLASSANISLTAVRLPPNAPPTMSSATMGTARHVAASTIAVTMARMLSPLGRLVRDLSISAIYIWEIESLGERGRAFRIG